MSETPKKPGRWAVDVTQPCPLCGAKCVSAGELAFTRKNGDKWVGPLAEFACGLFMVQPGSGTKAEQIPEMWNGCTGVGVNGKPVVDIQKGDYEVRAGKPDPVPPWLEYAGMTLIFSTDGTSSYSNRRDS